MDLRATNENNKNNIDNEMGSFERFEAELKNTIFGIMFLVIKDQDISVYFTALVALVHFLQLLTFPFHATIKDVWNSPKIVDVIHDIVNGVNIAPWIKDANWSLYITLFYVGVCAIGFAVILSIYASYAFSHKKGSFTWPITALKYLFASFFTVLFLPIFDYFVSMLACVEDPITKSSVHSYFTDVVCWGSTHITHAVIAIIMIIIFLSIVGVVSLTFFEYKNLNNDPLARIHSRQYFLMIVYETIMVLCLTFLTGSEFQILILALILIGSIILFVKFYLAYPFHSETMGMVWSVLMAVNLWTAVMLVFAKIMENTLFEGSVIAWLLGIPFVILIILTNRDPRVDLLLINVNKFQSPQEVQDQIRYLLKMIEWQAEKKNSAILLDGYIEIHKQSCNQDDCPLKQKNTKNNRFNKNLMNQDDTISEKYAVLIQLVFKMYTQAIKKFPNSTSLRIAYAFFLLDKMQSKQQALQELSQAEQNKPPFDEQFVIFRYKKIIEDEIAESQAEGQGGLDVVSEIAFQNHLRQLQANIEKSALLHMEFWSQLSEDNPDLAKLNDIGSKINSSVHNVEEHWTKLLKINASNAKAVRLYGKYLIEIINDKEAGDNLLEKARNLSNTQTNKRAIQMIGAGGDDYSNEATPTVWVSGEQDKFGEITGINLTAASLFGYNKTELLNRKVNVLMPQLYAKHHDSFLEAYMASGEGSLVGKNKERLVFGKNKSNYIFPVYYGVRVVQSIIQGTQFIATFRVEKNFKNAAYILTQPDGTIDSISSSAISLLKIDLKIINQKKGNIQDLIPNLIRDRQSIFTSTNAGRSLATVNYNYPKDSEYLLENDDISAQLHCYLYELIFLGGRENAGYQLRFERIINKSTLIADKNAKISNFQFRFERSRATVIGEYAEGSTNTDYQSNTQEDEMLGGIQNTDQENSDHERDPMESPQKSQVDEEHEEQKVNYGQGIKTLRLVGGRPQEIEDEKGEDDSDEEGEFSQQSKEPSQNKQQQQLVQQEEDAQEEGSYRDFSTTFKSRKALTSVINDKSIPPAIKTLRIVINLLGVVFLAIAITDYAIAVNEFDKINTQVDLLDKSNMRLSEMMNALSKTRDLTLINIGLLSDIYNQTELRSYLKSSLDTAKSLKQELEQQTWSLSTPHLALLNNPSITLVSLSSGNNTKGLTQAMEEVVSRAYDIVSRNITDLLATNSDVYFVTYNLLNGFYSGLAASSQFYALELTDRVESKGNTFLILMIASIVALVLALIVLFPILRQVNKTREEVLSLFLDIPEKTVKGLYTKCETFISNLQVGEDEDMISEIDDEELEKPQGEHETQDFIPRRRRKKFKNSGRSQHDFFIKFLIVVVVLEAYFIFTYVSTALLLDDIATLIPEFNATSAAEPFFSFANNAERQLFINNTNMVAVGQNITQVSTDNIKAMYDLDSLILEEHSINRKIHTDGYANTFNTIMMSSPCISINNTAAANATCSAFADQTVLQGMTVALSRHFENLRTLLSCYNKIRANDPTQPCTITPNVSMAVDSDPLVNKTMNLMRTTQATEINTMQHYYIKQTFRILLREFKASIKETFDDELTVRIAVFIVFIVVLVIVYVALWQTLVRSMSNEIWRTKSMLNMIPLSVISKIKSIRLYLKRFWNDMNIAEA